MASRDDYRKFDELLDLIRGLCQPILGLTYDDITQQLNCSRKTAERAIKFLSERFDDAFVATSDPMNPKMRRFRLETPDGVPPEYLRPREIIALNAAIKRIKNEDIQAPLKDLEYKLNRMLQVKKSVRELNDIEGMVLSRTNAAMPHPHITSDPMVLSAAQHAILSTTKIKMTYEYSDGKTAEYTVCPLGILYGKSNNYLVVYKDSDKKKIRNFIISRIRSVKNTHERFDIGDFDIQKYAQESFGVFHSEHGPYDIEWLAAADVADEIARYVFHPTQNFIKNSDGTTTIRFRADGLREMAWYLFQWGGKIVPRAPSELVSVYRELLANATTALDQGRPI